LIDVLLCEYRFAHPANTQSLQDRPHRKGWHCTLGTSRLLQLLCMRVLVLTAKGKARGRGHRCGPVPSSPPGQDGSRLVGAVQVFLHARGFAWRFDRAGEGCGKRDVSPVAFA